MKSVTAVLLLGCLALQGCYRLAEVDPDAADRPLAAVRTAQGNTVRFAQDEEARWDGSVLEVRVVGADSAQAIIPRDMINAFYLRELSPWKTAGAVALGAGAAFVVFAMIAFSDRNTGFDGSGGCVLPGPACGQ